MPDLQGRPILWQPSPRQREFLAAPDDEVLYGGAAGGGKSDALMFDALGIPYEALKWDKYRALLVRKTYAETEQLVDRAAFWYPKVWPGVRKSGHEFIFPSGAKIVFGYLDHENDRFQYAGDEYQWCGLDECTLQKSSVGIEYLWYFRMRSTNPKIPVMKRAATNPGNVGHAWVKKWWRIPNDGSPTRFSIQQTVIDPTTGEETIVTIRRRFIPAKLWDNVHAPDSYRTTYAASLQMLPEKDRRKFLDGRWDVMEGQFFTEWDPAMHVVDPFEVPKDWPRWIAMDWGMSHPYSIGVYAMDFAGVIYRYKEAYGWGGEPNVGTREKAREVAERLKKLIEPERRARIQFLNNPADKSMWNNVGHERSIADEFLKAGIMIRKSSSGPNSRISGLNEIRQRLSDRTFKATRNCEHLIRTLPDVQADPQKDGDTLDGQEDHAIDELMYSLVSRRPKATRSARQSPPPPTSGAYLDWLQEQQRLQQQQRLTGRLR